MSGSTHESNTERFTWANKMLSRKVFADQCDEIRYQLLRGRLANNVCEDEGMPAHGTVLKHARGDCDCDGERPPLRFNGDEWEVDR